jgi:hypothetical protein
MLRGERTSRNPRAREPVGNSSTAIISCDAIAVIGPVLLRWADARHRTVYQGIGREAPVDGQ